MTQRMSIKGAIIGTTIGVLAAVNGNAMAFRRALTSKTFFVTAVSILMALN